MQSLPDLLTAPLQHAPVAAAVIQREDSTIRWANTRFNTEFGDHSGRTWESLFEPLTLRGNTTIGRYRHYSVAITKHSVDVDYDLLYCEPQSALSDDYLDFVRRTASVLVHRLRSPITALMGFLSIDQMDESTAQFVRKGFDEIRTILDQLEALTQQDAVQIQQQNLHQLTLAAIEERDRTEQQKIKIASAGDQQAPPTAETDASIYRFIIDELLDNAFEAMDDELSTVTIRLHPARKRVDVSQSSGHLTTSEAQQLFHPFYTTKARGMGLGLTKALQRARQCGHELALTKNSRTEGVTISLFL